VTDDWRASFDGSRPAGVAKPQIEAHPEEDGVRLVDPIEGVDFTLLTPEPVEPVKCETDGFYFPVDTAASISTDRIETPYGVDVWIRDSGGEFVAQSEEDSVVSVPTERYNIDISSTQIKIYFVVNSSLKVDLRGERATITFPEANKLFVGARSLHEQPATTIQTTERPEDLMAAVSTFGSALKTTTCERSFPSLRGHPPLLEFGDSLSVPDALESPPTNTRIQIPRKCEYIYPVISLAYYLGATVEPGDSPRLIANDRSYPLAENDQFEDQVAKTLKQIFTLDCLTRTEGYYQIDLQGRESIERTLSLDFSKLYQMSLGEQIEAYLSIPYETIEEIVPEWKLVADVVPESTYAEALPFFADELAVVRCPTTDTIETASPDKASEPVRDLFDSIADDEGDPFSRGDGKSISVFQTPSSNSSEHLYLGNGVPLNAGKVSSDALYRRLEGDLSKDISTKIVVVCNDQSMAAENVVTELYEDPDWANSEVSLRNGLTTSELCELLQQDIDFLHYVGHVDDDGLECTDGYLDTQSLGAVNVQSFLLNACQSYDQGRELVDKGARGGVVTLAKISNIEGVRFGKTFAGLLAKGMPIGQALKLIESCSAVDSEFAVIGDPSFQLVRNPSGITEIYNITKQEGREYSLVAENGFTDQYALGTFITDRIFDPSTKVLCGNDYERQNVTPDQVSNLIENSTSVVILNGDIVGPDSDTDL